MKTESTCNGNCCQGRICECSDGLPEGSGMAVAVVLAVIVWAVAAIVWMSLRSVA